MIFNSHSMQKILLILQNSLKKNHSTTFKILNPDIGEDYYSGEIIHIEGQDYLYRGYKSWIDLAELLKCKILTPTVDIFPLVALTFVKLNTTSFHTDKKENEKYGVDSNFSKIHKMEEPAFLYYYQQALHNVHIANRKRVLNLGINRADEFLLIKNLLDTNRYKKIDFTGIDYSKSAIAHAKYILPEKNMLFYVEDINCIDNLKLKRFDLLISIGTLQSPNIHFKTFLMKLVQEYLTKDAAIILGFPNSRWVGGEMLYGAKAPNYAMSEMSLLFNDVIFCKKYLQQKKFRVTITGKSYIFLTATKIHTKF